MVNHCVLKVDAAHVVCLVLVVPLLGYVFQANQTETIGKLGLLGSYLRPVDFRVGTHDTMFCWLILARNQAQHKQYRVTICSLNRHKKGSLEKDRAMSFYGKPLPHVWLGACALHAGVVLSSVQLAVRGVKRMDIDI